MDNKLLKGISLILYGILLCSGGPEINSTLFSGFSEFPFSFMGVCIGTAGLIMVFAKTTNK